MRVWGEREAVPGVGGCGGGVRWFWAGARGRAVADVANGWATVECAPLMCEPLDV